MKRRRTPLSYLLSDRGIRRNIRALLKAVLFILVVVGIYTVLFVVLMAYAEGKTYSWITGFYWTLTTMSTVGYGDIVFESEVGRLFSIAVLISGLMLLFMVLPVTFLRFF